MQRIYLLRHAPREDYSNRVSSGRPFDCHAPKIKKMMGEFLAWEEQGKRVCFLASPFETAWQTAGAMTEAMNGKVEIVTPEGTFTDEPYKGHKEVRGVFPHFALSEHYFEKGWGFGDMNWLIETFPFFKEAVTPLELKVKAGTMERNDALKTMLDLQNSYVNSMARAEPLKKVLDSVKVLDTVVIVTHSGSVHNLARIILGEKEAADLFKKYGDIDCMGGVRIDFFDPVRAVKIGPYIGYGEVRK